MLRSAPSRSALRALPLPLTARSNPIIRVPFPRQSASQLCTQRRRPAAHINPAATALVRHAASKAKPVDHIDAAAEQAYAREKLEPAPDVVSTTSSTHPLLSEVATPDEEKDTDMMAGIRSELKMVRDTFSLAEVPREAYYIGMAGVLPYLATSLSTVYCAWEINESAATGSGLLLTHHTAEAVLHILEPLQVGYGAVILSFLGAIHWGLEWANYGGTHGYRRYAIGVLAPAAAWPTILFPVEYALISQFLAFNMLYYADSRACMRGWAPPWYGVYRFVLTFIVGGSIVVSLIGRGQIGDQVAKPPGVAERIQRLRDSQGKAHEEEERVKRERKVEGDED